MAQFKLSGVPVHAQNLFRRLRDAACESEGRGYKWLDAYRALLDTQDPEEAKERLEGAKLYLGAINGVVASEHVPDWVGSVDLSEPHRGRTVGVITFKTKIAMPVEYLLKDGSPKSGTPVVITKWLMMDDVLHILELTAG